MSRIRNKTLYDRQFRLLNPLKGFLPTDRKMLRQDRHDKEELQNLLGIINRIRLIDEILKAAYGTPTLGNYSDPIDEIVYLTLSQKTRLETARKVFHELKQAVKTWDAFLDNPEAFTAILSKGGRGEQRRKILARVLGSIRTRYSCLSLEFLRETTPEEAKSELVDGLGMGEKTAYCVMIYSLGMDAFPVDTNIIRIFKRLGFLDELLGDLEKMDHRQIQASAARHIPPDIGRSLHVNMVVHGRQMCKSKPKCSMCPIVKFCQFYGASKEAIRKGPVVVDLFAGPGGLSLGFTDAGWQVAYALEQDMCSAQTYGFNHVGVKVVIRDIRNVDDSEFIQYADKHEVDLILAGVPCQGFSLTGYRVRPDLEDRPTQEEDHRNSLFLEVFRAVDAINPKFVLFENVPGMSTGRVNYNGSPSPVVDALFVEFEKREYRSAKMILSAEKFGAPQKRRRLFIIGSRVCDPADIKHKLESMSVEGSLRTVGNAIGDLPPLKPNDGLPIRALGNEFDEMEQVWGPETPRTVLFGHVTRPHNEQDLLIIRALRQGMTYRELYEERPDIIEKRRKSKYKVYTPSNFHDKFFRLVADKPSRTIVSHLAKDGNSFIHPQQDRSLTPREAARIQSFPDDYIFFGSRSSQFIQIGNAVPPTMAETIAKVIGEHIR